MSVNIQLLVIDPQKDFVSPRGSLSVVGADADMDRLAVFIKKMGDRLADVHATLDSHRIVDISHPGWWKNSKGQHPAPFTLLKVEGSGIQGYNLLANNAPLGEFTTTRPGSYTRSIKYLRELEASKRYPHVIWPEHCLIGDEGHQVWPAVAEAFHDWERALLSESATVDFVTKGSNPWTEHFSGVKAEVPDANDPSTQVNTGLIRTLEEADVILLAGEALSHCMANTVRDIADNFGDPKYVEKLHLLRDCTSNVTGFDKFGDDFIRDLSAKGMKVTTTTQFLAQI